MFIFYLFILMLIYLLMVTSKKINDCDKIYYSDVQKIMIRNERPKNKILINNMLKKMSLRSGVSPDIIRNCAKQKKMN